MNDNEKLNRAFENVDDKYIAAAMQPPRRARRVWQTIGTVAACLAILVGAYFPIRNAFRDPISSNDRPSDDNPSDDTPGDDNPSDDNPSDDNPSDDNPSDDNPSDDNPSDDNPSDDNPSDDNPSDDNPSDDNPSDDNPSDDNPSDDNPSDDNPSDDPSAPPLPWDDTLYLKGGAKKTSYVPGETVELQFEIGFKNDYLGNGALRLAVKALHFDVSVEGYTCKDGVVVIDGITSEQYSVEQPLSIKVILTPVYREAYAMGTISLSVGFVPDNGDELNDKIAASNVPDNYSDWQTIFFEEGALRLESAELDYAADKVELILDSAPMSAVDTWEIMIARHYEGGKITAREFADMYYHWAYEDKIYASIDSYMTVEHTVRFSYMSKNIRYTSLEYIDAPEMWALYEKVQAFERGGWENRHSPEADAARRALAEYILLYMKEQGIITAQEYEAEADWMAQASRVGNAEMGYDQNIAPYARVIQKYMYTH